MTWQLPTYPHHEFCVAPDHRCLAELERKAKGVTEEADDTGLSLHDIPLSLRRWVWGRGSRQKATVTTQHPS